MPISAPDTLLRVADLHAGYGKIGILHGVELTIGRGEIVALVGPNGAGKTTLLRGISGLIRAQAGAILFEGTDLRGLGPSHIVRRGLCHVIEGHRIFTQLSVHDNILLAGYGLPRSELAVRVEEALAVFPEIAERRHERGASLSGGQQQMLAVAQGLVRRPHLLMLDEPSAGLSPVLVDRVFEAAARLRQAGGSVLLVEQLIDKALPVADRVCAMVRGAMVLDRPTGSPGLSDEIAAAYFS
ncbi:MAG TPA: ABC transporter ATP-binding protein [Hyphomicrobiales bacterium]|nr:ABC transporter ATP-binding protein [Hyphomicrobiales bacterium]